MRNGTIPEEHAPQMLAELSCTGRTWNDFVSFDPRLPPHLQLFVCRMYRDDRLVRGLEDAVQQFNGEIDEQIAQLPGCGKPQLVATVLEMTAGDELEF
jgi:hypothetical protein